MTTHNTTDSNEQQGEHFDHHPTCSRRGGTSCPCRASLAAVEGDVYDALKLVSTILHEQLHDERQPVGKCLTFPCSKVNAILAAASSPLPAEPPPIDAHRCPHCGRRMVSEFDEDVGFWRECANCDYREQVSSAPAEPEGEQEKW